MIARIAVLLVALGFLPGCTLVGLGVGAATPKTELRMVEEEATHAEPGETVRLQMKSGEELTGTVSASEASSVEIVPTQQQTVTYQNGYAQWGSPSQQPQSPPEAVTVPVDHIQTVHVQKVEWIKKSRALKGFWIGLAIDAGLATLSALAYGLMQAASLTATASTSTSYGGSSQCWMFCHW